MSENVPEIEREFGLHPLRMKLRDLAKDPEFHSERGYNFTKCFPESDDESEEEEELQFWHPEDMKDNVAGIRFASLTSEYWLQNRRNDLVFLIRNEDPIGEYEKPTEKPFESSKQERGLWIRHSMYLEARLTRYAKASEIISGRYLVDLTQLHEFNEHVLTQIQRYISDLAPIFKERGHERIASSSRLQPDERDFFHLYKAAHYLLCEALVNKLSRCMCLDASKTYFYEIWRHANMFDDIAVLTQIDRYILEPSEQLKVAKYGECDFLLYYEFLDIPCHKAVVSRFTEVFAGPLGDNFDLGPYLNSLVTNYKVEGLFHLIEWFYTKAVPKKFEVVIAMAQVAQALTVREFTSMIADISPPKKLHNWILWQNYGKESDCRVWAAAMTSMLYAFEHYVKWYNDRLSYLGTNRHPHWKACFPTDLNDLDFAELYWLLSHPYLKTNDEPILVGLYRMTDMNVACSEVEQKESKKTSRHLAKFHVLLEHVRISCISSKLLNNLGVDFSFSRKRETLMRIVEDVKAKEMPHLAPRKPWPQMLVLAELPGRTKKPQSSYNNHKIYGYSFISKKWYVLFRPQLTGSYCVESDPAGRNMYFVVSQGPCSGNTWLFEFREFDLFRMKWRKNLSCMNRTRPSNHHMYTAFKVKTEGDTPKVIEPELSLRFMRTFDYPFILYFRYKGKRNCADYYLAKTSRPQYQEELGAEPFPVYYYHSQDEFPGFYGNETTSLDDQSLIGLVNSVCPAMKAKHLSTQEPELFEVPTVHSFSDETKIETIRDSVQCRHKEDCVRINSYLYAFDKGKNVNKVRITVDPLNYLVEQKKHECPCPHSDSEYDAMPINRSQVIYHVSEGDIPDMPTTRTKFSSIQIGNHLFVGGGTDHSGVGAIDVLNVETNKWMKPIRTPKLVTSKMKLMKIDMPWRIFMKEML